MTTQQLENPSPATGSDRVAVDALDQQTYEIREVTEVGEVEEVLALRHRVYAETEALRGFLDQDGPPLLMDSHDRFARLFGLFVRNPADSRLIGTIRMVTMDPGPACMALEMIAAPYPKLVKRLRTARLKPLPILELCSDGGVMAAHVTRAMARGEAIVEAGRFAIDPEFRAGRVPQIRLARYMIESMMAHLFIPNGCDHAFIGCVPGHLALYERVGFRVVQGAGSIQTPSAGSALVCLEVGREAVAGEVRSRVLACAAELAATGRIVLEPATEDGERASNVRDVAPRPELPVRRFAPSAITHPALRVSTAC